MILLFASFLLFFRVFEVPTSDYYYKNQFFSKGYTKNDFLQYHILGLCSAIYNSIAWPAAIGGVEGAIAAYTSQLEKVKLAGDEINLRMTGLDTSMKETIAFLETEVKIIIEWQEDVENVQDTVSQFNAQQLSELKEVFIDGIDDLQASAQAFLDRPDNVFGS